MEELINREEALAPSEARATSPRVESFQGVYTLRELKQYSQ